MSKRAKQQLDEVPLAQAARKLSALVRRLPEAPDGRIALTVGGEVRAWLVAEPAPASQESEDEPSRKVTRLVRQVIKAARE